MDPPAGCLTRKVVPFDTFRIAGDVACGPSSCKCCQLALSASAARPAVRPWRARPAVRPQAPSFGGLLVRFVYFPCLVITVRE